MESPEQDLMPDHLRPFYIEGAVVVRYVRPIAGRPEADVRLDCRVVGATDPVRAGGTNLELWG